MRYLIATCTFLALLSTAYADNMSHEEAVVRTAYAKFAYASEQYAMTQIATESLDNVVGIKPSSLTSNERIAASQVNFTLSDFVVGNVTDIIHRKATAFITPASGEILMANQREYQVAEGGTMFAAHSIEPNWQQAFPVPQEALGLSLEDVYQSEWHLLWPNSRWQRYISYSVVVDYQGKSIGPYKALFVFGHDDSGAEVIEPQDAMTDARALGFVIKEPLFPSALVNTRLRASAAVANWLSAKEIAAPSCSVGQGDVCCDLNTLQCGPGRDDLTAALAKPIAKPGAVRTGSLP
jgi:hypothetical protein